MGCAMCSVLRGVEGFWGCKEKVPRAGCGGGEEGKGETGRGSACVSHVCLCVALLFRQAV